MRPSMFMAMVHTETPYTLRSMYSSLRDHEKDVVAYAPGSLGQIVHNTDDWIIGSIGLKHVFETTKCSVLVFANGKIKISGGCRDFDTGTLLFEEWLLAHRIQPVMRMLGLSASTHTLGLLNGSHLLPDVNMVTFHDIWNKLKRHTDVFIVTPPSAYTNPVKRGRICSVGVRLTSFPGTMRFDHSGKMQMFGFKSFSQMQTAIDRIEEHLKKM